MLGLLELIILLIIGIGGLLLFRNITSKAGAKSKTTSSQPDSVSDTPKTASKPVSSPPSDPRARPSSLPESGGKSSALTGVGWRPAPGSLSTPISSHELKQTDSIKAIPLFSKTKIIGHVRGLSQRQAPANMLICSFRVETFDSHGNRQQAVTVEMKGVDFQGSLNEGDQVEIDKKPRPGKAIKIKKLRNITAGAMFKVQDYPFYVRIISVPMTLMGWIISAAVVIGFFWLLIAIISDL